ncbi:MAG: hypothetical protein Q9203_001312 [Teloschistes exilis]
MADSSDTSSQIQPNLDTYATGFTPGGQGPIPLTTIFTPPQSCLSTVTYDGTSFWEGGLLQTGDQNCYPPRFTDIFNSAYSPGICPSGWMSAGGIGGFIGDSGVPGTAIYCCLSGFFAISTDAGYLQHVCASQFGTPLKNVYSTSIRAEGPIPRNAHLITVDPESVSATTVFADIIAVKYESTDSVILQLMAARASSSASSASATPAHRTTAQLSPTMSPTSTPTPAPISTPLPDRLSPGASAGIGVGAVLGAIALVLFAYSLWRRRQKSQPLAGDSEAKRHQYMAKLDPENRVPVELSSETAREMPASDMRPEIGSDHA